MNPHCRIGRITFKSGGALRLLKGGGPQPRADRLVSYARQMAVMEHDLAGFIVITWDAEGGYRISADAPDCNPIPRTLLPAWSAEVIRRELVMPRVVREIVDEYAAPPCRPRG
jgi:hypothetical protein